MNSPPFKSLFSRRQMNKPILVALFLSIGQAGCSTAPVATVQPVASGSSIAAERSSVICVLVPHDAAFEGEFYSGSGSEVAEKIRDTLEKIGRSSRLVSLAQANVLTLCKEKEAALVLQPTILHYEDRATGWSGKPDRIELKLSLYKLDQPDQMRSIYYEAKSSIMYSAFFEWGNAKPSALLQDDFEHSILKLLRQATE